jgi:hypothetical protein
MTDFSGVAILLKEGGRDHTSRGYFSGGSTKLDISENVREFPGAVKVTSTSRQEGP